MSNNKNLEAQRAKAAFDFARVGFEKQSKNKEFNYSAAVQELASIIRMNGLRAAMAYFYSKKDDAHKAVFEQTRKWFAVDEPTGILKSKFPDNEPDDQKASNFMKILIDLKDDEYRIVQAETMALATWMIRFAKAPDTDNSNKKQPADGNTK